MNLMWLKVPISQTLADRLQRPTGVEKMTSDDPTGIFLGDGVGEKWFRHSRTSLPAQQSVSSVKCSGGMEQRLRSPPQASFLSNLTVRSARVHGE